MKARNCVSPNILPKLELKIEKLELDPKNFQDTPGLFSQTIAHHPFLEAAAIGDCEKIKKLISTINLNLDYQDNTGKTALLYATINGHIDVVRLLIEKTADVNISDKGGNSALIYSIMFYHSGITKILLQAGSNANHQNYRQMTALMI